MSEYKCNVCQVMVTRNSADDKHCAGDYPWWNCCNCAATKNGWAGWNRRACEQCRQRDLLVCVHASIRAIEQMALWELVRVCVCACVRRNARSCVCARAFVVSECELHIRRWLNRFRRLYNMKIGV